MIGAMDKLDLIDAAGGVKPLADLLGLTTQAVYKWRSGVPPLQQFRIRELRPQWFRKGGPMHAPAQPDVTDPQAAA